MLQGIGLFETLRLVRGRAPLVALHAARLAQSCRPLRLTVPTVDWDAVLKELARRNRRRSGMARITLGPDFALVTTSALPRGLAAERRDGIELESVMLRRPAATLKGTSRLALWLAERAAGAETLLVGPRGRALETSRSNLFALTPAGLETAVAPEVLPGIARGLVVEVARGLGVEVHLRAPRLKQRSEWIEAFVTNAVRGVRPVRRIDGVALRRPVPGRVTFQLQLELDLRMGLR